jgi:hypothetical protein
VKHSVAGLLGTLRRLWFVELSESNPHEEKSPEDSKFLEYAALDCTGWYRPPK